MTKSKLQALQLHRRVLSRYASTLKASIMEAVEASPNEHSQFKLLVWRLTVIDQRFWRTGDRQIVGTRPSRAKRQTAFQSVSYHLGIGQITNAESDDHRIHVLGHQVDTPRYTQAGCRYACHQTSPLVWSKPRHKRLVRRAVSNISSTSHRATRHCRLLRPRNQPESTS